MDRTELIAGLKYITDGPGHARGGFHPRTVEIAQAALEALNTAADQSRVIAVMRTALEHYANPEVHVYVDEESGRTILDRREDANKATDALAEAARIMEGDICKHVRNSGYKTDYCSKCGEYIRGEFCALCCHPKPDHFEPDTAIPKYCCDGCGGYVEHIMEGK